MSDPNLQDLPTEQPHPGSHRLDAMTSLEIVQLMNQEDAVAIHAVQAVLPQVAVAVDLLAAALGAGGRCFYVGAGTSGRLALLDAAECPPTFGVEPDLFQVVMAGGVEAFGSAREGAEDDETAGARDLLARGPKPPDIVVGLAASGRTPYVLGAVAAARRAGLTTVGIACNAGTPLQAAVDVAITPAVGPEVLLGSTRLKSGTAQKLILNMLSTAAMTRLGRVYRNLMIDMRPTNEKLRARAVRMAALAAEQPEAAARAALEQAGWRVKTAVVMLKLGISAAEADARLASACGFVRRACGEERGEPV